MITGLRIAEMARRQGEGGHVQRMEVIVKRKRRSEAFVEIQKKKIWVGGGGAG